MPRKRLPARPAAPGGRAAPPAAPGPVRERDTLESRAAFRRARTVVMREWERHGRPPCRICGTPIGPGDRRAVDHVTPYMACRRHDPADMRVVHYVCNMLGSPAAWDRLTVEWHPPGTPCPPGPCWTGLPGMVSGMVPVFRHQPGTGGVYGALVDARMSGAERTRPVAGFPDDPETVYDVAVSYSFGTPEPWGTYDAVWWRVHALHDPRFGIEVGDGGRWLMGGHPGVLYYRPYFG